MDAPREAHPPLDIAHVVPGLSAAFGGPSRGVPALCEHLARHGARVRLFSQRFGEGLGVTLVPDPLLVETTVVGAVRLPWARMTVSHRLAAAMRSSCAARPPALLHDHGAWLQSNRIAASVARDLAIPLVSSPHGTLLRWSLDHHRLRKRIAMRLYQRDLLEGAKAFVAHSEMEGEDLRVLGLGQPIAVIPNGVPIPDSIENATHRANESRTRTALFLGRLHASKGIADLITAWRRLEPCGWQLLIAGPDESGLAAGFLRDARAMGSDGRVRFLGPVEGDAKRQLYASADLFILPSHSESFGIVVAEALANAIPVIATHGTPWQVVEQRRCGWWIPIGSASLEATLSQAMGLPDGERTAMGLRGRSLVEECFSWNLAATRMMAVYQWLLHLGPKPSCVRTD